MRFGVDTSLIRAAAGCAVEKSKILPGCMVLGFLFVNTKRNFPFVRSIQQSVELAAAQATENGLFARCIGGEIQPI